MNFNEVLTSEHLEAISKIGKCDVSEIQVFAIPDSLAISYLLTTKEQAGQYYREYAGREGKLIENPFSWDEFEGYNNRLILFPGGHAVCSTPFKEPRKSEFEAISEALEESGRFEIRKIDI